MSKNSVIGQKTNDVKQNGNVGANVRKQKKMTMSAAIVQTKKTPMSVDQCLKKTMSQKTPMLADQCQTKSM
jgi:hypothetical protein